MPRAIALDGVPAEAVREPRQVNYDGRPIVNRRVEPAGNNGWPWTDDRAAENDLEVVAELRDASSAYPILINVPLVGRARRPPPSVHYAGRRWGFVALQRDDASRRMRAIYTETA